MTRQELWTQFNAHLAHGSMIAAIKCIALAILLVGKAEEK